MLIAFEDVLKPYQNLKRRHEGLVVYNRDPLDLGRIKVKVQGILETADINKLPWVYPRESNSRGGRPDSAETAVPPLYSMVTVEFPQFSDNPLVGGSVYYPVWSGMARVDYTNPPIAKANPTPEDPGLTYPYGVGASKSEDIETSVWVKSVSENVSWMRIDKNLGSWEFYDQDSNSAIRWDRGGNVEMKVQSLHLEVVESMRCEIGLDCHFQVGRNTFWDTTNDTTINTGQDFANHAGHNIDERAENAVGITATAATVGIFSGTDTGVTAGGNIVEQAGGDISEAAGGSIIENASMVAVTAGAVGITGAADIALTAGGSISELAGADISMTATGIISALAVQTFLPDTGAIPAPPVPAPSLPPDIPPAELGTVDLLLALLALAKAELIRRFTAWDLVVASLQGEAAATRAAGQKIKQAIMDWANTLVGTAI